jgi:hypothetical protein
MDPEEPPFETPVEKEYNRVLGELAKTKSECSSRLAKLGEEASALASQMGGTSSSGGDHGLPESGVFNKTSGLPDGSPIPAVGNDTVVFMANKTDGVFNITRLGPSSTGGPSLNRTIHGDLSVNRTSVVDCPPCPRFSCSECPPISTPPDECGPSTTSGGNLDTTDSTSTILATPEAVLVGAAATLLVLLLAAVVGLFLRYVPVLISGLLILVLVAVVWYLSSKYPGAARRLGARIWEALRSGATAVVERLFRRNHPEVSVKYCLCRGI